MKQFTKSRLITGLIRGFIIGLPYGFAFGYFTEPIFGIVIGFIIWFFVWFNIVEGSGNQLKEESEKTGDIPNNIKTLKEKLDEANTIRESYEVYFVTPIGSDIEKEAKEKMVKLWNELQKTRKRKRILSI